ncbi:MAG: hypothetical protein V7L25_05165 [Nostoc sp.]
MTPAKRPTSQTIAEIKGYFARFLAIGFGILLLLATLPKGSRRGAR